VFAKSIPLEEPTNKAEKQFGTKACFIPYS
jgi:hypothetical protein